ncbi:HPr family phosphocarrier protein [Mycoplasmopsis felis]
MYYEYYGLLGIKHGAEITIKASGDDEDAAISAIKKAFEENQLI